MEKSIIIVGAVPPPFMGPTVATKIILNSSLRNEFKLIHFDTSDHRDLRQLGVVDFTNIYLSIKHYLCLFVLILKKRPEVIYMPINQTTLGYFRDTIFILISKLFGRNVICHLRGGNFRNWYSSSSALTRWFVRRVHSLVDGQIVLGESLRNLFEGILPDEKIFVVPNGTNFPDFVYAASSEQCVNLNKKISILFLSNFIREKGLFDVIAAIPEIMRFGGNIEFVFAGEWIDKETKIEFDRFIKGHSNLPIRLLGPVNGKLKLDLFSSADIFVFPTYYPPEGHPWVIVEAMAAGLPIITTDQGAITESVKEGVNGFIVEKRNSQKIAEKIKFLIDHPDIRKKMGEESRRLYLENFTEEKMIERLSCAFHAVLSRGCAE
jgi:glycosyltransferase involved in cell wall biosynthesis